MLPHEKALVKRLENQPFALIGINTDKPSAFREQAKTQGVTWRNSLQGSTSGELCQSWGVRRFPTLYVLDGKGVVRYVDVYYDALEKAVERLLAEQKSQQ
jgi:hypothetical protein